MAKATKNAAKKNEVTKTVKAVKATKAVAPKAVKTAPVKAVATVKASTALNPYRENGGYWATVEALRGLGMDTLHPFESIIPAVKKVFGLNWSEFKNKDARNDNGKDAEQRIIQNVGVVARKDYGAPLRELGFEVRFDGRQKVAGLFKIKPAK